MSARPTKIELPNRVCPKCKGRGLVKTNQADGCTVELSCPRRGCSYLIELRNGRNVKPGKSKKD